MRQLIYLTLLAVGLILMSCGDTKKRNTTSHSEVKEISHASSNFTWKGANIYFLLTDRFNNGDVSNDINFDRLK